MKKKLIKVLFIIFSFLLPINVMAGGDGGFFYIKKVMEKENIYKIKIEDANKELFFKNCKSITLSLKPIEKERDHALLEQFKSNEKLKNKDNVISLGKRD